MATHQAFMQDPMIAQAILGKTLRLNKSCLHCKLTWQSTLAFMYRQQMEENSGVPLPRTKRRDARRYGSSIAQSSRTGRAAAYPDSPTAGRTATGTAESSRPSGSRCSKLELQLKQGEQQRKAAKDQADAQLDAARLQLDTQKAQTTAAIESSRIAAQNEQAQAKNDLDEAKAIMDLKLRTQQTQPGEDR